MAFFDNQPTSDLEPVIRMSFENISVVNYDCRFAPNFEFCFDFLKMHDWVQQAKLLTYTQLEPYERSKQKWNYWGKFAIFEI